MKASAVDLRTLSFPLQNKETNKYKSHTEGMKQSSAVDVNMRTLMLETTPWVSYRTGLHAHSSMREGGFYLITSPHVPNPPTAPKYNTNTCTHLRVLTRNPYLYFQPRKTKQEKKRNP